VRERERERERERVGRQEDAVIDGPVSEV